MEIVKTKDKPMLLPILYNAAKTWLMHDFKARSLKEAPLFILQILSFAVLGVFFGALVEYIVELIPRERTERVKCGALVLYQLFLITLIIFFATVLTNADTYTLVRAKWRGYLFLLTFFVAQGSISSNISCMLNLQYF